MKCSAWFGGVARAPKDIGLTAGGRRGLRFCGLDGAARAERCVVRRVYRIRGDGERRVRAGLAGVVFGPIGPVVIRRARHGPEVLRVAAGHLDDLGAHGDRLTRRALQPSIALGADRE